MFIIRLWKLAHRLRTSTSLPINQRERHLQKWSVKIGSRTLICPATPSSNPRSANTLYAAARCCLRYKRSSSRLSNLGYERTLSGLPEAVLPMAPTDALSDVSEWRVVATGAILMGGEAGGEIWCNRVTERSGYEALERIWNEIDGANSEDEVDTDYSSLAILLSTKTVVEVDVILEAGHRRPYTRTGRSRPRIPAAYILHVGREARAACWRGWLSQRSPLGNIAGDRLQSNCWLSNHSG